jgi:nucleoid-associated protein YgaU
VRPGRAALVALALGVARAAAGAEPESYEVRGGDTLWAIAERTLGDPSLWPALYRANRDRIKDPARVYPGQRLSVPQVSPRERRAIRAEARGIVSD